MTEWFGLGVIIILGHEGSNEMVPHPLGSWRLQSNTGSGREAGAKDELPKVSFVEAGGMMSCAVNQDGVLWMWGHCPSPIDEGGSELSFSLSNYRMPEPVAGLKGLNVTKVACGNEHIVTLVISHSTGKHACYAWGNNRYGQLGVGDRENRALPQLVQAFGEPNVGSPSDVSCGAYHSAVVTHNTKMEEDASLKRVSMCWTFGMGENGQLGHGDTVSLALPQMIESLPSNERILAVSCGLFHMGVVFEEGGVWIWGMEMGLGLCPGLGPPGVGGGDYLYPVRVRGSDVFAASHGLGLACGAAHTVMAAVNDGKSTLWAWGRGQRGVLGTGQSADSLLPCRVAWPSDKTSTLEGRTSPPQLDQMLALAQKEICALTTELSITKKRYSSLYAGVYGSSGPGEAGNAWEALREWDKKVAESSYGELVRLDEFYRQARAGVKEALLQKKVENYCKHFMKALKDGGKDVMI